MEKAKIERIIKRYYDSLEEGVILGRKCTRCGHVEYPPYLICNTCGCLETEWYDMKDEKFVCVQLLPPAAAFSEPEFKANVGDYFMGAIQSEHGDEFGSCIINVDPSTYDELCVKVPFAVKPIIKQDVDEKMVLFELAE